MIIGKIRKLIKYFAIVIRLIYIYLYELIKRKNRNEILLIPQFDKSGGGGRTYFFSLIELLNVNNKKITILLKNNQLNDEISNFLSKNNCTFIVDDYNSPIIRFGDKICTRANIIPALLFVNEIFYLFKLLKSTRVSHIFASITNPDEYLPFFFFPLKVTYTIHTVPWFEQDRVKSIFLNKTLSKNKTLLTVSDFSKKEIIKLWNIKNSQFVKYIYNYFEAVNNINRCEKPENETTVLTIGTVTSYKNPLFWIEVAKQSTKQFSGRKVNFIWAGNGDLLEVCKESTKDYLNINFIGFQKDVDSLYQNADIYFQPSLMESHGIAVVGAMYYNLPCVVSNIQGLPESVENDESGFIVDISDNMQSIEKISFLVENKDVRIKFGQKANEIYYSKFTREKWVKETKDFIC